MIVFSESEVDDESVKSDADSDDSWTTQEDFPSDVILKSVFPTSKFQCVYVFGYVCALNIEVSVSVWVCLCVSR
jgi:hypothetical protein